MARGKVDSGSFDDLYDSLPDRMTDLGKSPKRPTGIVVLDAILDGGLPAGKSIGLAGAEGSGKSTIVMNIMKNWCAQGLRCLYLDYEKGVSENMIDSMGLRQFLYTRENRDGNFILMTPDTFGDGEKILDSLLPLGQLALVCVDSSTFMAVDKLLAENDKDKISVTDSRPGEQARIMSTWLEKYLALGGRYGCTFIYIQQMRTKIGISFGEQTTVQASGGAALKHAVSCSIYLKRRAYIDKNGINAQGKTEKTHVGSEVEIWTEKSRISPSFVSGRMTVLFGKGVSNIYAYMDWLSNSKVDVDGKMVPRLSMAGAGFYTLRLNSGEIKARGESEVYKQVQTHLPEIKEMMKADGGYRLIKLGDDE